MITALLFLAQAAAPAATAPAQADARCLAVLGAIADSDQPELQRAAQLGALYFFGKLLGRDPAIDLKAAISEAARSVIANPRPEILRCGAELKASGEALKAVGQSLHDVPPPPLPPAVTPRRP